MYLDDGARSEPVLVAYGITTENKPVLVHLDGVSAESTDACVLPSSSRSSRAVILAAPVGYPVAARVAGFPGRVGGG